MQNTEIKKVRAEQSSMLQAFNAIKIKKGIKKDNSEFLMKRQEMLRR